MLCKPAAAGLAESTTIISEAAGIAGFIVLPAYRDLRRTLALILRLRGMAFGAAVYVGNPTFSRRRFARWRCLMRAGAVPNRIGFRPRVMAAGRAMPGHFPAAPQPGLQRSQAAARLDNLAEDGIDVSVESGLSFPLLTLSPARRSEAKLWLGRRRCWPERALVAICPGAASPANIWPIERFAEIGRRLIQTNRFELVVTGGPNEASLGRRLAEAWGRGVNAAGQLPVLGSAGILNECRFLIGLDTGTTHLAAALGVPCVDIQGGRMPPGSWDSPGLGHIIVRHPVNCVGCRLTSCIISEHPCMQGLTVEAVWRAVVDMVQQLDAIKGLSSATAGSGAVIPEVTGTVAGRPPHPVSQSGLP
jgi:ADP-heptose:LPS heptosyltransferase